ncbi:MAG: pilus assembly protein [Gemmataceae bacterium]|nr:pilus assembly protein [Gemmataceae bacterium]
MLFRRTKRAGAAAVEGAIAYGLALLFILGLVVGGMGIFRYQEVATLAREAARYACVRGAQYQEETGKAAATAEEIYKQAILPRATSLDTKRLSYAVKWNSSNRPLTVIDDASRPIGNTVSVTVTYQWLPELFFVGPLMLTSTSTVQMCY